MVMLEDGARIDDATIALQLQQFLDEWHYRVLHANLGYTQDRNECAKKAMDILEFSGIELSRHEKEQLAEADEDAMVDYLVQKMPADCRQGFEHFALQLQLVISTSTRIRHAIDDNLKEDIQKVMEDVDQGITQQILKQVVVEAGTEIGQLRDLHDGWQRPTDARVQRLNAASWEADRLQEELAMVRSKLAGFGKEQNAKSKKMLTSMAGNNEKALLQACMSAWVSDHEQYKLDKDIHEKFRKQIADAEAKLKGHKMGNLSQIGGLMEQRSTTAKNELLADVMKIWLDEVKQAKANAKLEQEQKILAEKMAKEKNKQQANKMKVMKRLAAGKDGTLLVFCLQAWQAGVKEAQQDKELAGAVAQAEAQLKEYMKKKSSEARGVLNKVAGGSDSALLHMCTKAWGEVIQEVKRNRVLDQEVKSVENKQKALSKRQKASAKGVCERLNKEEDLNFIGHVFYQWQTEAKLERLYKHYQGMLNAKKDQLDAVQQMFKSFATQLEAGISNTPRSQRKSRTQRSDGGSTADPAARPPLPA
eukprot:CAMPEP_0178460934 /NCGR_PEP_ID=MMETSP0689_2-20121128/49007_1 /TAXON_ID=160604 /ORGANISM="Amphidinium massartii, Strain CS-259" /LENGTH=532 /DNA_ID=CAMNT_0020087669 /DNA_START=33 /DNA_END=1627 /DNA_ORIENTATION=+